MHVVQGLAYSVSMPWLALDQWLPVPAEPVKQPSCCCMRANLMPSNFHLVSQQGCSGLSHSAASAQAPPRYF